VIRYAFWMPGWRGRAWRMRWVVKIVLGSRSTLSLALVRTFALVYVKQ
jgi:hypothetical protein